MLDLFHKYATDAKAEQEGKEFDWGGGVWLLIARSQNDKYTRMMNKLYEAHKHTLDLKGTEEEVKAGKELSHEIMAEVMSHSILLGWRGPVAYNGAPLPYSTLNAKKLLLMKDFQVEVDRKASDFKNYRIHTEGEDVKNSPPTSSGTSLGEASSTTSSS